jgi:uncharacterized protein YlxW (UPF0749 family)
MRIIRLSLALGMSALICGAEAQAQVQRQPGTVTSAQAAPGTMTAPIDPLKAEVQQLRGEVNRLQAALASLRLTVNANQAAFQKHHHEIPSYGVVSAKTICPNTQVDPKTLIVFDIAGMKNTGFSGPPE